MTFCTQPKRQNLAQYDTHSNSGMLHPESAKHNHAFSAPSFNLSHVSIISLLSFVVVPVSLVLHSLCTVSVLLPIL